MVYANTCPKQQKFNAYIHPLEDLSFQPQSRQHQEAKTGEATSYDDADLGEHTLQLFLQNPGLVSDPTI